MYDFQTIENIEQVSYLHGYADACKNYDTPAIIFRILIGFIGGLMIGSSITFIIMMRLYA